jgi:hypothetical protein
MDTGHKYSSVGRRINAKRQTGERSAAFLEYSKKVLAELKQDVDHGVRVDPETVRNIERAISRHQPADRAPQDLSKKINELKAFGRGRQQ